MYKDEYHPRVKRDLKKLDHSVREEIKSIHIQTIRTNPKVGETLVGDLAGVRSYHFKAANQDYRIAYVHSEPERKVFILMIAKRESFYTVLKRRV